jgi:predicted nucleic acid-binding protein
VPLVCDATALIALGGIGSIALLQHVDPDVVISPWVRERELRQYRSQVSRGVEEGWLRVQEPSATEVRQLIAIGQSTYELDRGEAETLIVARNQAGRATSVLIDEGNAFRFVLRGCVERGHQAASRRRRRRHEAA